MIWPEGALTPVEKSLGDFLRAIVLAEREKNLGGQECGFESRGIDFAVFGFKRAGCGFVEGQRATGFGQREKRLGEHVGESGMKEGAIGELGFEPDCRPFQDVFDENIPTELVGTNRRQHVFEKPGDLARFIARP